MVVCTCNFVGTHRPSNFKHRCFGRNQKEDRRKSCGVAPRALPTNQVSKHHRTNQPPSRTTHHAPKQSTTNPPPQRASITSTHQPTSTHNNRTNPHQKHPAQPHHPLSKPTTSQGKHHWHAPTNQHAQQPHQPAPKKSTTLSERPRTHNPHQKHPAQPHHPLTKPTTAQGKHH
jgi:hypothetical protein